MRKELLLIAIFCFFGCQSHTPQLIQPGKVSADLNGFSIDEIQNRQGDSLPCVWEFKNDQLKELIVLSQKKEGSLNSVEVSIKTADAPGTYYGENEFPTVIEGKMLLHYDGEKLGSIANIDLQCKKIPFKKP